MFKYQFKMVKRKVRNLYLYANPCIIISTLNDIFEGKFKISSKRFHWNVILCDSEGGKQQYNITTERNLN